MHYTLIMQNTSVLTKQKSKASTSQSSARLPLPLDQISLNDRDNPSSNSELPTISNVPLETISEAENSPLHCTGVHGDLKHSVFRELKSDIDPNDEESCVSPQNLKRDTTKCTTVLSEESQISPHLKLNVMRNAAKKNRLNVVQRNKVLQDLRNCLPDPHCPRYWLNPRWLNSKRASTRLQNSIPSQPLLLPYLTHLHQVWRMSQGRLCGRRG